MVIMVRSLSAWHGTALALIALATVAVDLTAAKCALNRSILGQIT